MADIEREAVVIGPHITIEDPDAELASLEVGPGATVATIKRICSALSNHRGDVVAVITGVAGRPCVVFHREPIDESMPMYMRRQG